MPLDPHPLSTAPALVVSPHGLFSRLVAARLEKLGCLVRCCPDEASARSALAELPARLLVLDADLPAPGIVAFCRSLRRDMEPPLYLLCCGPGQDQALARDSLAAGANAYAAKPFEPLTFSRQLEQGLAALTQRGEPEELPAAPALSAAFADAALTAVALAADPEPDENDPGLNEICNADESWRTLTMVDAQLRRYGGEANVMLIDLPDWPALISRYGAALGETLVVQLGGRLLGQPRRSDMLGYLGGGQFVLLLSGTGDYQVPALLGRFGSVVHTLTVPWAEGEIEPRLTIALARLPLEGRDIRAILTPPVRQTLLHFGPSLPML